MPNPPVLTHESRVTSCWKWIFGESTLSTFSDPVVQMLTELEQETKFVSNYLFENDDLGVQVPIHTDDFIRYCVLEIFDLNKLSITDHEFLNLLCRSLFKCLTTELPDTSGSINDISWDQQENERKIYKSLALAFVLKRAGSIFNRTYQPKLAAKYRQHSLYYQQLATGWLENSRARSFNVTKKMLTHSSESRPDWCKIGMHEIAYHGKFTEFLNHRTCVTVAKERWRKGDCEREIFSKQRCCRLAPRTSYILHVISNVLYVTLFTIIMLSMNRIEYHENMPSSDADNSSMWNETFPVDNENQIVNESLSIWEETLLMWNKTFTLWNNTFLVWNKTMSSLNDPSALSDSSNSPLNDYELVFILRVVLFFWQTMFIAQVWMNFENASSSEIYLCTSFLISLVLFFMLMVLKYSRGPLFLWIIMRFAFDISFHGSFILSALIVLRHFTADRFLGAVVRLLSRMSRMLVSFVTVFFVFWMTYAVTILSLTGEVIALSEIPWKLFENGGFEIFADMKDEMKIGKIASCESSSIRTNEKAADCLIRSWLIPISLLVYVLVCTIVLINLITSFLTSAYDELKSDSCPEAEVHYEFYRRLEEYSMKPQLPPPLTIFPLLAEVCCCCCRKTRVTDLPADNCNRPLPHSANGIQPSFTSILIPDYPESGEVLPLLQNRSEASDQTPAIQITTHSSLILSRPMPSDSSIVLS